MDKNYINQLLLLGLQVFPCFTDHQVFCFSLSWDKTLMALAFNNVNSDVSNICLSGACGNNQNLFNMEINQTKCEILHGILN